MGCVKRGRTLGEPFLFQDQDAPPPKWKVKIEITESSDPQTHESASIPRSFCLKMWPFTLSLPNPDPVWKVLPSKKHWDFLKHCVWMDTKFRCNMISDVLSNYSLCKTSRTICAKVRNYVPIHLNHTQYSRTHCYSPSSICDFPIQRSSTTSKQKQLTQEEWYARQHSYLSGIPTDQLPGNGIATSLAWAKFLGTKWMKLGRIFDGFV